MRFERMRKETLVKIIHKCHIEIDPTLHVTALRHLVAQAIPTYIEDHFLRLIRRDLLPAISGLRTPGRNQCHLPESKLEFDFSWKSRMVSVEIHGGLKHRGSGHRTEAGVKRDMIKCNLAQVHGWFHLQLSTEDVMDEARWRHYTLPMLKKALNRNGPILPIK